MKHLFLTAFMAIFGVYALGLVGLIDMQSAEKTHAPHVAEATTPQVLSFTQRIAMNDHAKDHAGKSGYTLKAMR